MNGVRRYVHNTWRRKSEGYHEEHDWGRKPLIWQGTSDGYIRKHEEPTWLIMGIWNLAYHDKYEARKPDRHGKGNLW